MDVTAYTVGKRIFITSLTCDPATGVEIATLSATAEIYYCTEQGHYDVHPLTNPPVDLAAMGGLTSLWGSSIDFSAYIPDYNTPTSNPSQLRFQSMVVLVRATIVGGVMSRLCSIRGGPAGPLFSIGSNSPSMP